LVNSDAEDSASILQDASFGQTMVEDIIRPDDIMMTEDITRFKEADILVGERIVCGYGKLRADARRFLKSSEKAISSGNHYFQFYLSGIETNIYLKFGVTDQSRTMFPGHGLRVSETDVVGIAVNKDNGKLAFDRNGKVCTSRTFSMSQVYVSVSSLEEDHLHRVELRELPCSLMPAASFKRIG